VFFQVVKTTQSRERTERTLLTAVISALRKRSGARRKAADRHDSSLLISNYFWRSPSQHGDKR
jgi:hypothetical protein